MKQAREVDDTQARSCNVMIYNCLRLSVKDAAKDVEMLKQQFTKAEYVNSNGTVDKWILPESVDSIEEGLDKQFDKFKDVLLKKLEKGDNDVNLGR